MPTLREILAGYELANAWEAEERRRRLPELSVEESVRQYVEMWELARKLAPDAEAIARERNLAHYEWLHAELERAAEVMGRACSK